MGEELDRRGASAEALGTATEMAKLEVKRAYKLLSEASELLAQEAGNKDQVARRNGSELLLWTLEINRSAQLEQTAQKLLEQLHALPSTKRQSKVPIRFHAAGSTSQGHLDISFLLEEVNFRLFLARLRDSRTCFDA